MISNNLSNSNLKNYPKTLNHNKIKIVNLKLLNKKTKNY